MSGPETHELRCSYPGAGDERWEVSYGMDPSLKPEENVTLVRRPGCDKTTLLCALLLFSSPGPKDADKISLGGRPVRRGGTRALRAFRRAVQYMPQDVSTILHLRRLVLAQVVIPLHTLGVVHDHEEAASQARKILASLETHRET